MIEPFPIYRDKLVLKQLDFIPTHSARETRLHSFSDVDMADSRQVGIKVPAPFRFRGVVLLGAVVAVIEAGPVLATVDPADIRGLVTTRHWYVAELLRSMLECSAHHTTHNVNEDAPDRGRASVPAMTVLLPAGSIC